MSRTVSTGTVLLILWLALSGHGDPLLVGLGVLSCALVLFLHARMRRYAELEPMGRLDWTRMPGYLAWLAVEVFKSNVAVTRCILSPELPITPTVVRLPATQRSELGQALYANSITLTPGTVTLEVVPGEVEVHALTLDGARDLGSGEMDRRVSATEAG